VPFATLSLADRNSVFAFLDIAESHSVFINLVPDTVDFIYSL
jgi:hypothetical protein